MAAPAARRLAELTRINLRDALAMPAVPTRERLRRFYFEEIPRLCLGLIQSDEDDFRIGRLPLITLSEPKKLENGWEWMITGGLLARPGEAGRLRITAAEGEVAVELEGYRPWLPVDVYSLTQKPFHHLVTRLALRRLRRALRE